MKDEIEISADGLTKRFGELVAVENLRFQVRKGEIFGLLGPNGSGKSTTLRMLCGILLPTSGTAFVHGINVVEEPEGVKRCLGYMSQKFGLYDDLTVKENINFYGRIYIKDWKEVKRRTEKVIEELGLDGYKNFLASKLSGGWRQRLAFACAISHDPPVLFLDEPTAGVDPVSRRSFWEILYREASRGKTIFVTTHYMEEAERCDRIGFLWRGKLVAIGSPEEIKKKIITSRVYIIKGKIRKETKLLVSEVPEVEEVSQYGDELHIITSSSEDISQKIKEALMKNGEKHITLEESLPSLEDVFAYLSRRL